MVGRNRLEAPSVSRGRQVAKALAGSWRAPAPAAWEPRHEEVAEIAPLLIASGAAALAWRRLQHVAASRSPAGFTLQQAYRLYAIESLLRERQLLRTLARLRAVGVEPLIGSGWAAAREYPEACLRPYRDFDLFVGPGQRDLARDALRDAPAEVALAAGCAELNDRSWSLLNERARTVPLGGGHVRVFGAEDHLRLLALRMLRRGAGRAVWLCDLAVMVESAARFDWDAFLSGDARRSEWAAAGLLLARDLLGAELKGAPPAVARRALPHWLARTVLREWSLARTRSLPAARGPGAALRALRARWPNGVEATVGLGAPFNAMPRLPLQVAACVTRAGRAGARAAAPPHVALR
jgi:hypothetical protein